MMRVWLILVLTVALSGAACARGGGYNTTWDPAYSNGGWVCFKTQVAGCTKGYNATCNGVADDTAAITAFQADAASGALIKVYIPPGSNCMWDPFIGGFSAPNIIVWGYGAQVPAINLGGNGFYPETTGATSALIQQANAGDASVTVITGGDTTKFAVGDWIAVTGLSNQYHVGFPPNFTFCEYKVITSIVGSVISFGNGTLKNTYLTTWPDAGQDTNLLGGAARIYKMQPEWNTNAQYYGLKFKNVSPAGINISGKNIALYDLTMNNAGWGIANTASLFSFNLEVYEGTELDKDNTFMYNHRMHGRNLVMFSGSDNTVIFDNLILTGTLNGTTKNTTLNNSTIAQAFIGPTAYGVGEKLTLNGTTIGNILNPQNPPLYCPGLMLIDATQMAFSAGTFTIANASPAISNVYAMFVPGHKYYPADTDGSRDGGAWAFTVTSVGVSGSNVIVGTDLGGSLPASNCNTKIPCPTYASFPYTTLNVQLSNAPHIDQCVSP